MSKIPIQVSGELVIKLDDVPVDALSQMKSALTVPNEDREKAIAERVFGAWDMPEAVALWREDARRDGSRVLCLPRGCAASVIPGLAAMGHEVVLDDRRSRAPAAPGYFVPFLLRDYQHAAVLDLLRATQGVLEGPPGMGKSAAMLGAAAYAGQRTLVILDKANLLEQWRGAASKFLGLSLDLNDERSVGKIGDDVWEERDLTIALRQTLWSRLWATEATGWFESWGMTQLDECHHLSGDTLAEVVRRCCSFYLLGASATPAKTETQGRIVHSILGPIVHRVTREELYERDILVRPTVRVLESGLDADFWPTHEVGANEECKVPDCPKSGKKRHQHRNNYSSVLKKLVESKERNQLIASRIVGERGHVHLIFSRQLKHLDLLRKEIERAGWDGPIYMLRGEENAAGLSQHIAYAVEQGGHWEYVIDGGPDKGGEWEQIAPVGEHGHEAVILSTVAEEGMDMPAIDRVWMVFPMRQEGGVLQVVGRGERNFPGKTEAVVYDVVDQCWVFAEQAAARSAVYYKAGFRMEVS